MVTEKGVQRKIFGPKEEEVTLCRKLLYGGVTICTLHPVFLRGINEE
jgi:hypothetical protein